MSTYWKYFHSGGGYVSFFFLTLSFALCQSLFSASDFWLSIWTHAEQFRENITVTYDTSWKDQVDTFTGIYVYTGLIGGVFVFSMICAAHFYIVCLLSSVKLHDQMFNAVTRSPLAFFDTNPIGTEMIVALSIRKRTKLWKLN